MSDVSLLSLMLEFGVLSLLAFGGMTSVLPEMQRRMIDANGWLDARTFTDLYSLGYALPGPNVLVGTVIGFHLAGTAGALVATLALALPACLFTWFFMRIWHDFRESHWRRAVQRGLLPVTVGLTFAGSYLVIRGGADNWQAYALTAITVVVVLRTAWHPLWMIAAGAALGWFGFV